VKKGVCKTPVGYTFVACGGGGERNNTDGEQTTKKWEADEHAKT
jgi:hypothetical protein